MAVKGSYRIALVGKKVPPSWQSCKTISANLRAVYKAAFRQHVRCFNYDSQNITDCSWNTARAIVDYYPDRIVFLDHNPHPITLLQALQACYGLGRFPDLVFHVYGDFSLYAANWLDAWPLLSSTSCLFICASDRQNSLLKRLVFAPQGPHFPFPVDETVFRFLENERHQWRKKLGIPSSDKVGIYSGRISLQKNISLLLEEMASAIKSRNDLHLILAGAPDDLDAPLFGMKYAPGIYEDAVYKKYLRLDASVRKKIRMIGPVPHQTLNALYNASDFFVSMSLHHDEDYGMSAAEALMTGLPVCLTDWGGFAQFTENPEDGVSIPVSLASHGLRIDRKKIAAGILTLLEPEWAKNRQKIAERNRLKYSVKHAISKLRKLYENPIPPFRGFSALMTRTAFQLQGTGGPAYYPQKGGLYEEFYSAYLRPKE